MSTTFGIKVPEIDKPIEIAFRYGVGSGKTLIKFTNPLAALLPDETLVIPLDNSSQGIETIGDIKRAIKDRKLNLLERKINETY